MPTTPTIQGWGLRPTSIQVIITNTRNLSECIFVDVQNTTDI